MGKWAWLCSEVSTLNYLSQNTVFFLLPPQEVKGWYLGEQQHILGAEEGLHPHRFSDAVVTPALQITHISDPHSLYCDPGWFWWRLYPNLTIHTQYWSSLLQFIQVIALIASAYISCVNMFMQKYNENVDTFWQIFTWYVTLSHLNWQKENYLV